MSRCPTCGSQKTSNSFSNRNEHSCADCGSVFNPVMEKVYTKGNYTQFSENVTQMILENLSDASLGSAIKAIVEQHQAEDVHLLVEQLIDIAEDLYNDCMMNRRDKYDFKALLEGINRFNDFAALQGPQDDVAIPDVQAEVPSVEELPDPMSMVNPNVDGPIEVGEHGALETLKNAITAVQTAIQSLESAEAQEKSAGELNDGNGIAAIPNEEPVEPVAVGEGLQTAPMSVTSADPTLSSSPVETPVVPHIAPAGNEGPEHEAEEGAATAELKAALEQLQKAYADYIGSEEKVHPTSDIGDKLSALSTVSGVDDQTFLEKAKQVISEMVQEDAQLVNQDWLDKDLANSIAINTQEIGEDAALGSAPLAVEARAGENEIPTQIIRKPIVKENDPGTESGEITDQPGEVDMMGPIHTDDVNAGFSPENFFKEGDVATYENKKHIVEGIDGRHLVIRNPKTNHVIEVMIEDLESNPSEDIDIRGERFAESNISLLAEWEKIEKKMTEENLLNPKRNYDLRTNKPTEGL